MRILLFILLLVSMNSFSMIPEVQNLFRVVLSSAGIGALSPKAAMAFNRDDLTGGQYRRLSKVALFRESPPPSKLH